MIEKFQGLEQILICWLGIGSEQKKTGQNITGFVKISIKEKRSSFKPNWVDSNEVRNQGK